MIYVTLVSMGLGVWVQVMSQSVCGLVSKFASVSELCGLCNRGGGGDWIWIIPQRK